MLVIYMLPVVVLVAFITLYLSSGLSRPQPFPDGIRGVTAYVETVHFQELESEILEQRTNQDPEGVLQLTKLEQRCIQRKRLQWLAREVRAMKCNGILYRSAACWELAQAKGKKPAQHNDRERMAAMILETAPRCLLALTLLEFQIKFAAGLGYIRPSNQTLARPLLFMLEFGTRKYGDLTSCALTVAHSYGRIHYENLLSAL
jgi:hypothetical protein